MITGTNIDPIRAEIMRLECLDVFDQAGWERVLADLRAQGRECGRADAERRMRSAMGRQWLHVGIDFGMPGGEINLRLVPVLRKNGKSETTLASYVAVETEE